MENRLFVPKKFPAASIVRPAMGHQGLLPPANRNNTFSVQGPPGAEDRSKFEDGPTAGAAVTYATPITARAGRAVEIARPSAINGASGRCAELPIYETMENGVAWVAAEPVTAHVRTAIHRKSLSLILTDIRQRDGRSSHMDGKLCLIHREAARNGAEEKAGAPGQDRNGELVVGPDTATIIMLVGCFFWPHLSAEPNGKLANCFNGLGRCQENRAGSASWASPARNLRAGGRVAGVGGFNQPREMQLSAST